MKKVKCAVTITAILGFFAVMALIFLFLALSDIADMEPDLTLEWYISGICMLVISAFTLSSIVTLWLISRYTNIFEPSR